MTKKKTAAKPSPRFSAQGADYHIKFDAFVFEDIEAATGFDLADVAASGWVAISRSEAKLAKALAVLLGVDRAVLTTWDGTDFQNALAAAWEAAASFFPKPKTSAMRSNYEAQMAVKESKAGVEMMRDVQQAMTMLAAFPPETRKQMVLNEGGTISDWQKLEAQISSFGQANTQSITATASPESAASQQPV